MIIAAISENINTLNRLKQFLKTDGHVDGISTPINLVESHGGIDQAIAMIEQHHPNLVLLEGDLHDHQVTPIIGKITDNFPDIGIMLISRNKNADKVIELMRMGVSEILPLEFDRSTLINAINHFVAKRNRTKQTISKGKILTFIPCKGGSGATFIATNLAYALAAKTQKRVLLIDFNLQLGDALLFLSNENAPSTIADIARQINRLDSAFLASSVLNVLPNLSILASPAEPEKSTDVNVSHVSPILKVATQNYDFVIVDIGRRLDAITIQVLDESDSVYPILQQTLPFIRDAKRLINLFVSLGYSKKKINLIVNRYDKNNEITLDDMAEALRLPIFKTIPNDYAVVEKSVNHGDAVIHLTPKSVISKALIDIAEELCIEPESSKGWLKKIFH